MDELRNCKRCGRMFQFKGYSDICYNCYTRDEIEFKRIKEYLYEHPFAKIFEVSSDLDIPVSKLKRFLREGRLEIVEKTNAFLLCEKCGKPIRSGQYCDECLSQSNKDLKVIYTGTSSYLNGSRLNYRKTDGSSKRVATR